MRSRYGAIAVSMVIGLCRMVFAQNPVQSLKTPGETSGYSKYTQHEEVANFLSAASQASRQVKIQIIGKTLETKELPPVELRLCIITEEGIDNPRALNRRKLTFLIFAAQHGNEQSGKEAALQLIRDLAFGNLKPWLRKINVLVIPQSNPFGNFVNRRTNEQNLDLNRDHVKLEAPETRAIHAVFRAWMPEVTLDVHEKGDDYYRVSTGCVSNLNIHESLQRYSRERVFPALEKRVSADGFTWHEYLVSDFVGSASSAGVPDRQGDRVAREVLMRYSTTDLNDGRNAPGIYQTLSFIQEGASRHDLQTLEARTRWQYSGVRALVEFAANHAKEIRPLVSRRRAELLRQSRMPSAQSLVHMRMEYVRDPKEPELVLKQFDRASTGAGASAAEPRVVTQTVKYWLPRVESRLAVPRAAGYIIPSAQKELMKTLSDHGVSTAAIAKDFELEAETYRITDIQPAKEDYVAPERIAVEKQRTRLTAHQGDFFVSCNQPGANLITSLLEPQSEYGLTRYRVYKLAPAKGETFSIIRVPKAGKIPVTAR